MPVRLLDGIALISALLANKSIIAMYFVTNGVITGANRSFGA